MLVLLLLAHEADFESFSVAEIHARTHQAYCRTTGEEVVVCGNRDGYRLRRLPDRFTPPQPRAATTIGDATLSADAVRRREGPSLMVNLAIPF